MTDQSTGTQSLIDENPESIFMLAAGSHHTYQISQLKCQEKRTPYTLRSSSTKRKIPKKKIPP